LHGGEPEGPSYFRQTLLVPTRPVLGGAARLEPFDVFLVLVAPERVVERRLLRNVLVGVEADAGVADLSTGAK